MSGIPTAGIGSVKLNDGTYMPVVPYSIQVKQDLRLSSLDRSATAVRLVLAYINKYELTTFHSWDCLVQN